MVGSPLAMFGPETPPEWPFPRRAGSGQALAMSDPQTPADSVEDVKAQMKQALQRKHDAAPAGQAHLDGTGKAQEPHGKEGGVQRFQRKSG